MQGETLEETLQGVGPTAGEVGAEAVAADIFHALLVGEGRDGTCRVVLGEGLREEEEIGEAATRGEGGFLEGGKCRLYIDYDRGMMWLVWQPEEKINGPA